MGEPVIIIENLGKRFRLKHQQPTPYTTLRGELASWVRRAVSPRAGATRSASTEEFWAVRDVNAEVLRGDVVGVIGRNGAGKSTLLKLVSRIVEPTVGRIRLRGRVASLLEVGTGFHPELTGRENVYLNGAILGMSKYEIRKRFEEIVAFAEVEKFLDTPVKHYSSGMYMRLAFAVAAHLEPEILLVDEVLAVGDAEFQRKCVGKMKEVALHGRTVLFVSHTMHAIQSLCTRAIVMANGSVRFNGGVDEAVRLYGEMGSGAGVRWQRSQEPFRTGLAINAVDIVISGEQPRHTLLAQVELESVGSHPAAFLAIDIYDSAGIKIMQAMPKAEPFVEASAKRQVVTIEIDLPPLIPDRYSVGVWLGSHYTSTMDSVNECGTFEVAASPTVGRTFPFYRAHGCIVPTSRVIYNEPVKTSPGSISDITGEKGRV